MSLSKLFTPLILGVSILLQSCAGSPVRISEREVPAAPLSTSASEKQNLAHDLGGVQINDVVKPTGNKKNLIIAHKVLSEYTSATGLICRQIETRQIYTKTTTKGIICKNESSQWYWPRQIEFE